MLVMIIEGPRVHTKLPDIIMPIAKATASLFLTEATFRIRFLETGLRTRRRVR